MNIKKVVYGVFLGLIVFSYAHAYAITQNVSQKEIITNAYRSYGTVNPKIVVPTVVQIPLEGVFERSEFSVFSTKSNMFIPYLYRESKTQTKNFLAKGTSQDIFLSDGDMRTYAEFSVDGNSATRTSITISSTSNNPPQVQGLTLILENNVALPEKIEVQAVVADKNTIVVAEKLLDSSTISFPQTKATSWTVILTHAQPLRLTELRLLENSTSVVKKSIRFLAQPGDSYELYADPDRYVQKVATEAGDLSSDVDILSIPQLSLKNNPKYTEADSDTDSIPDIRDNCVSIPNSDQLDINSNGRGDACDDFDKDGISNSSDNCRDAVNVSQQDIDGDSIGDACDNEESRITEKYTWLPWVGIGAVLLIIIGLFVSMARGGKKEEVTEIMQSESSEIPKI
jgi:Thrombospondin type 3 repeat